MLLRCRMIEQSSSGERRAEFENGIQSRSLHLPITREMASELPLVLGCQLYVAFCDQWFENITFIGVVFIKCYLFVHCLRVAQVMYLALPIWQDGKAPTVRKKSSLEYMCARMCVCGCGCACSHVRLESSLCSRVWLESSQLVVQNLILLTC